MFIFYKPIYSLILLFVFYFTLFNFTTRLSIFVGLKPQTIDNDVAYSDYSIGFESSLEIVTNAIDMLHTTAFSHNRVMIVEVMGRVRDIYR